MDTLRKDSSVTLLITLAPDFLIAWLIMVATDGEQATFWWTWIGLVSVQTLFTFKHAIAASLLFKLYGKKRLTEAASHFLRMNNFPSVQPDEEVDAYFLRIAQSDDFPVNIRLVAASEQAKLELLEQQAILPVLRVRSAYNAALEKYHPL